MRSKNVKSYLAGFCVTALLAGSMAVPPAALGSSG
jgi:radical SAM modification target selenobiotic family peptide